MADGIIARMFPELDSTIETYKPALKALGRGIQTAPSGLLDLASLPFTVTGMVEPDQVPGSTAWMDKKGWLIPKQVGANPTDQFALESLELMGGLGLPSVAGGAISRPVKEGVEAIKSIGQAPKVPGHIPADRGQKANSLKMMTDAAKLSHDPKFAEQVADFRRMQDNSAKGIIEGFARSIGKADSKSDLGKRLQKNFGDWFDGVKSRYEKRNDENFNLVYKNPIARNNPIPESLTGQDRINNFVQQELAKGGDEAWKAALMDLQERGMADMTQEMSIQGLGQKLRAANQTFSKSEFKEGPYDRVDKNNISRLNAVYKEALKDRLEDTIAMGGQEAGVAADLKKANHVFEVTVNNLKKYQKQSLNKFLGAKEDEVLSLEGIVDRFQKLGSEERKFFSAVANKVDPEMVQVMRRKIFDDMVQGGIRIGRSSGESEFNITGFLNKVDTLKTKNPEMYDWVIGSDPKLAQRFNEIVDEARVATNYGTKVADESPTPGDALRRGGAAAFGVASGKIGAARVADVAFSRLQSMATDKDALFNHIFNDGPPPPSAASVVWDKATDAAGNVLMKFKNAATGKTGEGKGMRVGAAAEMAREGQSDPSLAEGAGPQVTDMPLGSSETGLEGDSSVVPDADLDWDSETPVEASTETVPDEDLDW